MKTGCWSSWPSVSPGCSPIWTHTGIALYIFVKALHQVEEHELARALRGRTLQLIMNQPSIFEYYSSETGQPSVMAADTFGWTAAVFIDLAIQASQEENNG